MFARKLGLLVTLALLLPVTLLLSPDARAETPCEQAIALIADAKPQSALDTSQRGVTMSEGAQRELCAVAAAVANDRIAASAAAASAAKSAYEKAAEGTDFAANKATAAQKVAEALGHDVSNAMAQELKPKIEALPSPGTPAGWVKNWDDWVKNTLGPLGTIVLLIMAWWLGLFLLRRAASRLMPYFPSGAIPPTLSRVIGFVGCLITLVVPVFMVLQPMLYPSTPALVGVSLIALSLLGALLMGWADTRRLQVAVGSDQPNSPQTRQVLSLLEEMGGSPPQGLERPGGLDVQILANALDGISTPAVAGFAKVIKVVVGFATREAPWQVFVDQTGSATSVSVVRLRRHVGSLTISPDKLKVAGVEPPLPVEPFIAAYVLTVLAAHHRPQDFSDLAGATHWRSIGLTYLASNEFRDRDMEAKQLLNRAVALDPANRTAQLNLHHVSWRQATDAQTLLSYRDWLTKQIEDMSVDRKKFERLLLRTHLVRAAVSTNFYFASGSEDRDGARDKAIDAANKLCRETVDFEKRNSDKKRGPFRKSPLLSKENNAWLDQVKATAAAYAESIPGAKRQAEARKPANKWKSLPMSAATHYAFACSYLAPLGATTPPSPQPSSPQSAGKEENGPREETPLTKGKKHLNAAKLDSTVAEWALKDPQLKTFRESDEGKKHFLKSPQTDLLAIEPFAAHAAQLERAGFTKSTDFTCESVNSLAKYVAADACTRLQMLNAATLCNDLKAFEQLAPLTLDIVTLLTARDLASRNSLFAMSRVSRLSLARELANELTWLVGAPTREILQTQLGRWLRRRREADRVCPAPTT